jgi:Acetyltransferase (GNAT) domain
MPPDANPPRDSVVGGYADPAYAEALAEFGEPRALPRCGGSLLVRRTPGADHLDAIGPYPLFACEDWSGLTEDLSELRDELVSVSLVADPFGGWTLEELQASFPDLMVPFKEHHVVDLSLDVEISSHHRRNARKALRDVDVEIVDPPADLVDDWIVLYENLVQRHEIKGMAAFSAESFARLFEVPGLVAIRASADGETVGATLWLVSGDVAYYHLGAYSERGYELKASFALFATALEHFGSEGLAWLGLGAGAGVGEGAGDGLDRFKDGWSTGTRTAYLCGRILSPDRYEELSRGAASTSYFPAYRAGEFA